MFVIPEYLTYNYVDDLLNQ